MKSSPTVAGDTVFAAAGPQYDEGRIFAFDAATGEERWRYEPAHQVTSSPTVVDGVVYVGLFESMLAVEAGVDGSSRDSRVRLGTLGHHDEWAATAADPSPAATATPTSGTATDTGSATDTTNGGSTGTDPGDGSDAETDDEDDSSGTAPGPGVVGALASLGGAGYLLSRRGDDESEQ
jgi:hypothetical protein